MPALQELKRELSRHCALPPAGPSFVSVYHSAFILEVEDASEAMRRFEAHTLAATAGVQSLRGVFGQFRQARLGACRRHYDRTGVLMIGQRCRRPRGCYHIRCSR